jgi:ligand-binding sensor domain-containing protein
MKQGHLKNALKGLVVLFFIIIKTNNTSAQDLLFEHLTPHDGLSFNQATVVYQDHRGYVWIGTLDGLNCYDGTSFQVFKNNVRDTASLISNNILSIAEDKSGGLWVGTDHGVSRMDIKTGKCLNFNEEHPERHGLTRDFKCCVLVDRKGKVWVGSHGGVYIYDPVKKHFDNHGVEE